MASEQSAIEFREKRKRRYCLINGNGTTDFPFNGIKTGSRYTMIPCGLNKKFRKIVVINIKYNCEKKIKEFLCINLRNPEAPNNNNKRTNLIIYKSKLHSHRHSK